MHTYKSSKLMIFSRNSIRYFIPNVNAVYYLRGIADENSLYPIYYIGRADNSNLKQELLNKFDNSEWSDIVYVNYIKCDDRIDAEEIQREEIQKHKPKYNSSGINTIMKAVSSPEVNLDYKLK